jgi:subtilisin family serine protease
VLVVLGPVLALVGPAVAPGPFGATGARAASVAAAPVVPDVATVPPVVPDDPLFAQQWGLRAVRAPQAWAAGDGHGVTVAVVDTGVDAEHPDLAGQVLPGINLLDPGTPPADRNGHGTAVAGIVAARTDNGVGVAGVAPGASILPVKVLDAAGDGSVPVVAAGIRWAASHGASVINLSLSNLVPGPLPAGLRTAVDAAWAKGVVCVIAAGNDPAQVAPRVADALVVTAVGPGGRSAPYASPVTGDPLAVAAPGGTGNGRPADDIVSTYWTARLGPTYALLSGTSMAAAFASGALADLISTGLSPRAAARRLVASATPLGDPDIFGAGLLDVERGVEEAAAASAAHLLPSAVRPASTSRAGGGPADDQTGGSGASGTGAESRDATGRAPAGRRAAAAAPGGPRSTGVPAALAWLAAAALAGTGAAAVGLGRRQRRLGAARRPDGAGRSA